METLLEQQKIARDVYEKLTVIDPRCLLAGGAPRDWYFGYAARDLDFYIETRKNSRAYEVGQQLESLGFVEDDRGYSVSYSDAVYESMGCLKRVWNLLLPPYDTPIQVVEIFGEPIGEKEGWYDGPTYKLPNVIAQGFNNTMSYPWAAYGKVVYPDAFEFSVKHKLIGVKEPESEYLDEAPNLEKLKSYFPEYTFVTMNAFNHFRDVYQKIKGESK